MKIYLPSEGESLESIFENMIKASKNNKATVYCKIGEEAYRSNESSKLEDFFKEDSDRKLEDDLAQCFFDMLDMLPEILEQHKRLPPRDLYSCRSYNCLAAKFWKLHRQLECGGTSRVFLRLISRRSVQRLRV